MFFSSNKIRITTSYGCSQIVCIYGSFYSCVYTVVRLKKTPISIYILKWMQQQQQIMNATSISWMRLFLYILTKIWLHGRRLTEGATSDNRTPRSLASYWLCIERRNRISLVTSNWPFSPLEGNTDVNTVHVKCARNCNIIPFI